jgi:hypothetical protein
MPAAELKFACRSAIRRKLVRDNRLGMDASVPQQLAEEAHRSLGITSFLDEYVEDFAFVVNGSPEPHALT